MKILNLGLDSSILDENSKLAKRAIEYGNLVEKYIVIAPFKEDKILKLSDKVVAYGAGMGNKIFGLFKVYKLAKEIIKEEDINVISAQDQYYLGFISLILARKFKKGLEIQVHGFEKYYGLRKLLAKYLLPRANAVRCVSQRLKKQLIDEFSVREERITIVPIFTDLSLRGPAVEAGTKQSRQSALTEIASPAAHNERVIFLTVGRLVPVKNIGMQIEAFKSVECRFPNVELWIVGDGSERRKLEVKSKKSKIINKIKFFGWQSDVDKFYGKADAFLLTSYSEGWPLVIMEAASYGLPIIITNVGSAGELIINNKSGIIIPVNDKIKLKKAMIDLIKNYELRKKIGEGAKQAIFNLPTKDKILKMYKKSWELAMTLTLVKSKK